MVDILKLFKNKLYRAFKSYDTLDELVDFEIEISENKISICPTYICVSGDDNGPIRYSYDLHVPLLEEEISNWRPELILVLKEWEPIIKKVTSISTLDFKSLSLLVNDMNPASRDLLSLMQAVESELAEKPSRKVLFFRDYIHKK